ncbi:MAG: flagellar biosynthesis protein FliQ [Pirellulaceae bacterium]
MDTSDAIQVGRELMMAAVLLSTPVVVVSLIVGLIISIAQTVTSIQEQTLSFAPRILAVCGVIVFLTPWYLQTLTTFTMHMFDRMASVGKIGF